MRWNMQIFPPGIFFPGGNFTKKFKWIYSKIPPEIYLEKFHLEKNNPAMEYIQTIGSPIQLLTMILLLNFTDFPSAWSTAPHHQLLKW